MMTASHLEDTPASRLGECRVVGCTWFAQQCRSDTCGPLLQENMNTTFNKDAIKS